MENIKLTKSARPILDKDVLSFLKSLDINNMLLSGTPAIAGTHTKDYLECFSAWLSSYNLFKVIGLEDFKGYVTDGITGAFPNFLYFRSDLQPVVLRGEYPLHRLSGIKTIDRYQDLKKGHKLYLSHPFSASGSKHPDLEEILEHTLLNEIPIFLDCAYFATSLISKIDLTKYYQICFIAFSLSKVFSTGRIRSGVCYSKEDSLPMSINTDWNYVNQLSLNLHIKLMKKFDANHFYEKYKKQQIHICKQLDLIPSSSYLFGLSDDQKYSFFSREKVTNRVCLSEAIENYSEKPMSFTFSER